MSLIRYVYLPLVAKPLKLNIPPELGPQYRQSRSALPLSSAWPAVGSPPAVASNWGWAWDYGVKAYYRIQIKHGALQKTCRYRFSQARPTCYMYRS